MIPTHASLPLDAIASLLDSDDSEPADYAAICREMRTMNPFDARFLGPQPWDVTDTGFRWFPEAHRGND